MRGKVNISRPISERLYFLVKMYLFICAVSRYLLIWYKRFFHPKIPLDLEIDKNQRKPNLTNEENVQTIRTPANTGSFLALSKLVNQHFIWSNKSENKFIKIIFKPIQTLLRNRFRVWLWLVLNKCDTHLVQSILTKKHHNLSHIVYTFPISSSMVAILGGVCESSSRNIRSRLNALAHFLTVETEGADTS